MVRISKSVKGTKLTKGPDSVAKAVAKPNRYCAECDHEFRRPAELIRHLTGTLIHNPTGARRYICDICQLGFTQFGNLASHIRTHYLDDPRPKEYLKEPFFQRIARLRMLYGKLAIARKGDFLAFSPAEPYIASPSPQPAPSVQVVDGHTEYSMCYPSATAPLIQPLVMITNDAIYGNPIKEPELGLHLLNFLNTALSSNEASATCQDWVTPAPTDAGVLDQFFDTPTSFNGLYVDQGLSSSSNSQLFATTNTTLTCSIPRHNQPLTSTDASTFLPDNGAQSSNECQSFLYDAPADSPQHALTNDFDIIGQQLQMSLPNASDPFMNETYGLMYPFGY